MPLASDSAPESSEPSPLASWSAPLASEPAPLATDAAPDARLAAPSDACPICSLMVLNPAYTLPRYCEISCWFSDAVATAVITSVSAGSRNAEAGVVATSITACRALLAGPPIDVAAAENEAGMVTTAA